MGPIGDVIFSQASPVRICGCTGPEAKIGGTPILHQRRGDGVRRMEETGGLGLGRKVPDRIQKSRRMGEARSVVLARSGRWNAGGTKVPLHLWHPKSFLVVVSGRGTSKASKFPRYGTKSDGKCSLYEYVTNGEELSQGRVYGKNVASSGITATVHVCATSLPVCAVDVRDDRSEGKAVSVSHQRRHMWAV